MTGSHVLLYCSGARVKSSREETWEGKDPGFVRVLLSNPFGRECYSDSWTSQK